MRISDWSSDVCSSVLQAIHRKDYRQPDYWIREVALDFDLLPEATKVTARLSVEPNAAGTAGAALVLAGEGGELLALKLGGQALSAADSTGEERSLSIAGSKKNTAERQLRMHSTKTC